VDVNYVDSLLARHYEIEYQGPTGTERVEWPGDERRGFIGTAVFLMMSGGYYRSSPARRGALIKFRALCESLPGPRPMPHDTMLNRDVGVREDLEAKTSGAACRECHDELNAYGAPLELFDAIGARQETDGHDQPLDLEATLPDGTRVSGPADLANWIAGDPRTSACAIQTLYEYALGRSLRDADQEYLAYFNALSQVEGQSFEKLATIIASSEPFRFRAEGP
jgi:hypothetical protein